MRYALLLLLSACLLHPSSVTSVRVLVVGSHTAVGAACVSRARSHLWSAHAIAPGMRNVTSVVANRQRENYTGVVVVRRAVNANGMAQLRANHHAVFPVSEVNEAVRTVDALLGRTL